MRKTFLLNFEGFVYFQDITKPSTSSQKKNVKGKKGSGTGSKGIKKSRVEIEYETESERTPSKIESY